MNSNHHIIADMLRNKGTEIIPTTHQVVANITLDDTTKYINPNSQYHCPQLCHQFSKQFTRKILLEAPRNRR
jgi:hypothetical protein